VRSSPVAITGWMARTRSALRAVATDTEGFMGQPATGKVIRTPAIQIFRLTHGQIAESWAVRDDLGTLC
jgi:predicted ester cyclase